MRGKMSCKMLLVKELYIFRREDEENNALPKAFGQEAYIYTVCSLIKGLQGCNQVPNQGITINQLDLQ